MASVYGEWMSVYDEWMSVYDEWMSVYGEWMSVYDEWMSVYDEWMSVYHEWMSVCDEWMSVYDEWIQWVLGVCKDMNGECVWRMLGECRCERLPEKSFVTLPCKLLCLTIYNFCIRLFENKLKLRLYTLHTLYNRCILYILCITDLYFTYSV